MDAYVRLAITDMPVAPAGGFPPGEPLARITRMFWYRLPRDWFAGGCLAAERRQRLLEHIYGPGRCAGEGDRSRYVVLELHEWVPTEDEIRARPWLTDRAVCYAWRADDDALEEVIPAQL